MPGPTATAGYSPSGMPTATPIANGYSTTTTTMTYHHGSSWVGWFGLIGLLGLIGLRGNSRPNV